MLGLVCGAAISGRQPLLGEAAIHMDRHQLHRVSGATVLHAAAIGTSPPSMRVAPIATPTTRLLRMTSLGFGV